MRLSEFVFDHSNNANLFLETAMSVSNQARFPVSAGARGLLRARWQYGEVLKNQESHLANAVAQLEFQLRQVPTVTSDATTSEVYDVSNKFRIMPNQLSKLFTQKYNCTPNVYAIKYKKSREGKPINI